MLNIDKVLLRDRKRIKFMFLGEHNVKNLAYANIGSEVDVAVIVDGKPIHGLVNLEGGHIR